MECRTGLFAVLIAARQSTRGAFARYGCIVRISVCFQGFFASRKHRVHVAVDDRFNRYRVFSTSCSFTLCTIAQESINLAVGSEGTGEGCH
jgi:hypothetical protein